MQKLIYLAAAVLALVPWALAQSEPTPPSAPDKTGPGLEARPGLETGTDLSDPAFDRYVDLAILGRAWATLDPELMADIGLQLEEGERVLLRPHKGLSASDVLGLAAQLASERRDKTTLDRLAKAAQRSDNKGLLAQVATAQKLASAARATDPALSVSVESTSPEDFALYQAYLQDIEAARLTADGKELEKIEKELPDLKGLSAVQVDALKKVTAAAREALPKDGGESDARKTRAVLAETLNKLANASRDNYVIPIGDGYYIPTPIRAPSPGEDVSHLDSPAYTPPPPPRRDGPALGTYGLGTSSGQMTDYQRRKFMQQYQQLRPHLFSTVPHH